MPSDAEVARCAPLANATRNSDPKSATAGATLGAGQANNSRMTGRELRAQLREQLRRNNELRERNFSGEESYGGATVGEHEAATDPAAKRRCAKALGMLSERPRSRYAMIVEAGPPPVLGLAIRGVAYGELMLPADYDPVPLMVLVEQHGTTVN